MNQRYWRQYPAPYYYPVPYPAPYPYHHYHYHHSCFGLGCWFRPYRNYWY